MPNKITIEYVRDFVDKKSNGKCKVLSNTYINDRTKLDLQCSCGNVFSQSYHTIKKSNLICNECRSKERSIRNRESIDSVIKYINSTGCTYISGEYINSSSILTIQCTCGNIFNKKYNDFKYKKQHRCQDCGNKIVSESKIKYTPEYVQEIVNKERGYNIDINSYTTSNRYVPCTCSKGHKFNLRFDWYLRGRSGCRECRLESQKGEGHPNWRGGENEVIDNIRKSIKDWKMEVMAYYGYKCVISGEYTENLVVHHTKAFMIIVNEVSNELNIPVLRKIKDYNNIEVFYKLKDEILKRHIVLDGVVLKKEIHDMYHNIYGRGNNTPEEFDEFLLSNYNLSLDQIRKERKSKLYIEKAS